MHLEDGECVTNPFQELILLQDLGLVQYFSSKKINFIVIELFQMTSQGRQHRNSRKEQFHKLNPVSHKTLETSQKKKEIYLKIFFIAVPIYDQINIYNINFLTMHFAFPTFYGVFFNVVHRFRPYFWSNYTKGFFPHINSNPGCGFGKIRIQIKKPIYNRSSFRHPEMLSFFFNYEIYSSSFSLKKKHKNIF